MRPSRLMPKTTFPSAQVSVSSGPRWRWHRRAASTAPRAAAAFVSVVQIRLSKPHTDTHTPQRLRVRGGRYRAPHPRPALANDVVLVPLAHIRPPSADVCATSRYAAVQQAYRELRDLELRPLGVDGALPSLYQATLSPA